MWGVAPVNGSPPSPSQRSSARYEAIAPIGTGGMATVFVGRVRGAIGGSRLVALKRAHSHVKNDERLAASMKLEARLASRLHHANVVSVLDVEEDDGDLVLILDYIEGCTLRSLSLKLEQFGEKHPREMMRIILDVAAGLHAAHQTTDEDGRLLGLVHRDVSPSNILVGVDGVTRIADFGIAKALVAASERTETGVLKGKSAYMAPEYVMMQRASAQSDLFSLAVVAWESLACARLFKGPNDIETLKRVMLAKTRPISEMDPSLAPLDPVLNRALAREPSDRQRSVEEMAIELLSVARAYNLVATHAEVSALVERMARDELAERRKLLRTATDDDSGAEMPTVVAPSLQLRSAAASQPMQPLPLPPPPQRVSVGRLSSTAAPITLQKPVAQQKRSIDVRQLESRTSIAESKSRGREMLALAGAFVLLGIALSAMAIQLGTAPPEEVAPQEIPSPAAPPPPAATSLPTLEDASLVVTDAAAVVATSPSTSASAEGSRHPRTPKPPGATAVPKKP